MYQSVRCSVKIGNVLSQSFSTKSGVKQGCILSPTLFSLFINDLKHNFYESCDQVQIGDRLISCLMYADDIVLLSNSAGGLQKLLNSLLQFCQRWNLKVNVAETKVIIFTKSGKVHKGFSFTYDGQTVEIVSEYKYLGIIFKPSGSFTEAINYLCETASKASFCIRKAVAFEYLNVDLFLNLYEHCVKPILLYCSEVWCLDKVMYRSSDLEQKYHILPIEKVQLKFCKILLGVHKSAVNNAVRAELGIFLLAIFCLKSCVNYWLHVIELNDNNLVYNAYSDEISCDTGFSHNIKLFLGKINFSHGQIKVHFPKQNYFMQLQSD